MCGLTDLIIMHHLFDGSYVTHLAKTRQHITLTHHAFTFCPLVFEVSRQDPRDGKQTGEMFMNPLAWKFSNKKAYGRSYKTSKHYKHSNKT